MSPLKRRDFLSGIAAGAATLAGPASAKSRSSASIRPPNPGSKPLAPAERSAEPAFRPRPPAPGPTLGPSVERLAEPAFRPLPLGAITPEGWLSRQLRIQADGLSGHLDEFWPDVARSKWFGGEAEGWERAPYWLDGAIPLAWILNDNPLKERISRYLEHIVGNQRPDGWYAPYPLDASSKPYDMWAILLANKAFVQYHEATGDERVLRAVERNLRAILSTLDRTPLFGWGKFRWFEGLIPVFYVYEKTREPWLLDLGRKLRDQGFDYPGFYRKRGDVAVPTPRRGLWKWDKHVVNTGMAPKLGGLAWRLDPNDASRKFPAEMIGILDEFHGQATGMFTGDECLSGRNPIQGTELCAVVEFMYSLETLLSVFGDPFFGDRLERVAFNALPATFAPDMWSHQYDQQTNQIQATINPDHMWTTNGPESNIYGLEPNFGCCTANMHQGWPKFAAHLWMRTPDDGIAALAYAPSTARFVSRGTPVTLSLATDYPFRETLRLTVKADAPVRFPLVLRVPAWAEGAAARIAGSPEVKLVPGTLHRLDREWKGAVEMDIRFPMKVRSTRRYNEAIAIERGPLVYALKIGEEWTRVNADKPQRELPHGDFEVKPTTPWNYGLIVDEKNPAASVVFEEKPVGERPFSPEGAGVRGIVKGRKLPGWRSAHGWAGEIPPGEADSKEPVEDLTLIPYGCTNIRITEFPKLKG